MRTAPSTGGVAKKRPTGVLSDVSNLNPEQRVDQAVLMDPNTDKSLEVVKLEETKYASICASVHANPVP